MNNKLSQIPRACHLLELLFRDVLEGVSVTELAQISGFAAPVVCRDLAQLEKVGWVKKLASERWSITTKPVP